MRLPPLRTQAGDDENLDWAYDQLAAALVGPTISQHSTFTVGNVSSITVTFATPEPDTNYNLFFTPTGATAVSNNGVYTVIAITRLTTGFTVFFLAAPGSGATVSYDYMVVRDLVR